MISIAQFRSAGTLTPAEVLTHGPASPRPEKNHRLQVESFAHFLQQKGAERLNARLVLVGSCRDQEDEKRIAALRALCAELGVEKQVQFEVGIKNEQLKAWLGRASVGLHTMWCEHFGIGVVELMILPHFQHAGGWCAELESFFVRPDRRSQGVGAALLAAAEERAVRAGCYRIQLTSRNVRTDAHRFYRRHGFDQGSQGFKKPLGAGSGEGGGYAEPGGGDEQQR